MAQTWSREELVSELDSAYSKLEALLDGVAEADAFDAVAVDAWTVHDVLAVRVWWAEAVAEWIGAGLRDEAPQTAGGGLQVDANTRTEPVGCRREHRHSGSGAS